MSQGRDLFALDWVKGELLETLGEARQALEAFAEQGRDETRMRVCLTKMHQVHGTLIMLELSGVALLADYMERLAQGLLDDKVTDVTEACEVLMQGLIELPQRLEHLQEGGKDSEHAVLALVNKAAAQLSLDPLLSGDTLDEQVSDTALARFERIDGTGKIRRIRAAYQSVLLSILKGEDGERSIDTLRKVAIGLERICNGAPAEAQWQAFGVFVDSLEGVERPLPAEVVKMLRRIDAEIRRFARDGAEAFLAPVHKSLIQQLLNAADMRREKDPHSERIRERAQFDPSVDELALSGRQALATAAVALREELGSIKDELDLYVRAENRQPEALVAMIDPLRRVASTCAVLGFESSRGILLDQAEIIESLAREEDPGTQPLLNVASSLVQVEDNLAGMGSSKETTEIERLQGDAEKQVLSESRSGLETVKQSIVDFVSSEFDPQHLADSPMQIYQVCGALNLAGLTRPVAALQDCRAFVEQELAGYAGNPGQVNWERLDRFADCISGIDYYLERLGEDPGAGAEDVIEVVERSLRGLGYEGRGAELDAPGEAGGDNSPSSDSAAVTTEDPATEESETAEAAPAADGAGLGELVEDLALGDHEVEPLSVLDVGPDMTPPAVEAPTETPDPLIEASDDDGEALDDLLDLDHAQFDEVHDPDGHTPDSQPEELLDSEANETPDDEPFDAAAQTEQHTLEADEAEAPAPEETEHVPEMVLDAPEAAMDPEEPVEANPFDLDALDLAEDAAEDVAEDIAHPDEVVTEASALHAPEEPVAEPDQEIAAAPAEEGFGEFDLSASQFDGLDEPEIEAAPEEAQAQSIGPAVDAEILEVFIEEVGEVVEQIDHWLSTWSGRLDHEEARVEVRRAFHTLKGSGRMVGADRLGELAWSVENMLNRVLDGTIDASEEIISVAHEARTLVPRLMQAFENGEQDDNPEVDRLLDHADVLASGGSLADPAEPEEDDAPEELAIFLEEARQIVTVLKARTGRRTVLLDDEAMMALHTLIGSASLVQLEHIEQLGDALYETARAFQAEALRGPNTEVEIARLFQDALEYIEREVERTGDHGEAAPATELLARAHDMLAAADDTPAEEMLVGLTQLDVVINAPSRFDAWREDASAANGFREEFSAAMQAIIGATFRPQVTDLAKSLMMALDVQNSSVELEDATADILKQGCERLLATVDAIAADRSLPRVDDIVTALGDLANGIVPDVHADPVFEQPPVVPVTIQRTVPVEPVPAIQPSVAASPSPGSPAEVVDPELAEVFFEEAEELMEALESMLNDWSDERENRLHLENLLRVLHTLKGSARLAGLAQAGDQVHQFESFLIDAQNDEIPVDDALFERSENQFEAVASLLAHTHAAMAHGEATGVAASAGPAAAPAADHTRDDAAEPAADAIEARGAGSETQTAKAPTLGPVEARPNQEVVRVRAGLLETLVNLAGENSILRARVEQGMNDFSVALDEMETTIERTREQLRRLEIETEAQVLYRQEQLDPGYDSFDPLEMDRYSQLQQLTRALSESASDMLDLKDTLLFKAREAETLLLQQARINTELQEGLMRTRMVPFSRLLPRLRRIVRQIAQELGKEVEFHAYNAEGELDRNLLERMIPPLEHMLRNAVDHGVEAPEVRRSFGKAPAGRIDLRLSREGGDIVIEIADDGAGIDVEAVRSKATERGLMHPQADLPDEEVLEFILAPGFSTAKSVTQISGRGVGLDVVNSEVKQLGGSVGITSTPGKGTRFVVRVPFTVSVNRALMVGIGDDQYAIPLNTIEGIVLLDPEHIEQLYNSQERTFDYAGVAYRVRYLGNYIGRPYTPIQGGANVPIVLVRSGDQSIAVHVDSVQGSREIVVKSLGPQFAGVGGISGATILGDGSVVVILDLVALIRSYGREGFVASKRGVYLERPNACVMVVDDSVTVRKVTARLLERQGMDVIVAKDGVEAVALLQERRPDVMLLDIEMPRMDGFEVARQVRHDTALADLPIIMISSRTGSKHTEHAKELGVDRFLGKPFQENELLSAIDELVSV